MSVNGIRWVHCFMRMLLHRCSLSWRFHIRNPACPRRLSSRLSRGVRRQVVRLCDCRTRYKYSRWACRSETRSKASKMTDYWGKIRCKAKQRILTKNIKWSWKKPGRDEILKWGTEEKSPLWTVYRSEATLSAKYAYASCYKGVLHVFNSTQVRSMIKSSVSSAVSLLAWFIVTLLLNSPSLRNHKNLSRRIGKIMYIYIFLFSRQWLLRRSALKYIATWEVYLKIVRKIKLSRRLRVNPYSKMRFETVPLSK